MMKNARRMRMAALLTAGVMAGLCLSGCGSDPESEGSQGSAQNVSGQQGSQAENKTEAAGYRIEIKGVTLGVDMDMNELLSGLGTSKSVFEAPSCAAQGTAYIYDYSSFEIETYPDGEKNLIGYITLKDDTIATAEGIDLSKTRADIIKAYGDKYEESGSHLTYTKDGMKLNFIFDGEDIISIEYASSVMQ